MLWIKYKRKHTYSNACFKKRELIFRSKLHVFIDDDCQNQQIRKSYSSKQ